MVHQETSWYMISRWIWYDLKGTLWQFCELLARTRRSPSKNKRRIQSKSTCLSLFVHLVMHRNVSKGRSEKCGRRHVHPQGLLSAPIPFLSFSALPQEIQACPKSEPSSCDQKEASRCWNGISSRESRDSSCLPLLSLSMSPRITVDRISIKSYVHVSSSKMASGFFCEKGMRPVGYTHTYSTYWKENQYINVWFIYNILQSIYMYIICIDLEY